MQFYIYVGWTLGFQHLGWAVKNSYVCMHMREVGKSKDVRHWNGQKNYRLENRIVSPHSASVVLL